MVPLQISLEKGFLSNSDPECVLVDCSICTEMVRFSLQPVVGRKDGTGKAGNTDLQVSAGERMWKGVVERGHNLAMLLKPRL